MFQNFTKKQKNLLGFTFLLLLVSVGFFLGYKERKALGMHATFTTGKIYDLTTSSKSPAVIVKYEYLIGQKRHKGQNDLVGSQKSEDFRMLHGTLIDKSFPVAYDSLDVDNSEILLTKEQYRRFKMERPVDLKESFRIIDSTNHRE